MSSITERGVELIKSFEGFSPRIYRCAGGWLTVGYGHIVKHNEIAEFSNGIDGSTAMKLLMQDIKVAERAVMALISVPLTECQFDSLTSFTFNLGAGSLQRSSMRQQINREEHENVPRELMKWVFAGGKKLKGLVLRRSAEGQLYCS